MNLEKYLEEIKTCPENKLSSKFGVYDNYPIVLGLDYEDAKTKLSLVPRLTYVKEPNTLNKPSGEVTIFNYDDGIHILCLKNSKYVMHFLDKTTQDRIEGKNFNSFFFIHPYQNTDNISFDKHKEMAEMISYLSEEFLMKQKISSFFPASGGNSDDSKKIVFYEPTRTIGAL